MIERIPLPRMSEFLLEEFMIPLNLTTRDVSDGIGISEKELQALLSDKQEMTLELSEKLGKYFGVSEMLFYNIQQDLKNRAEALEQEEKLTRSIAEARRAKGLTREQLAERAGISETDVSDIETGQLDISLRKLQQLARGLGKKLHIEFQPV